MAFPNTDIEALALLYLEKTADFSNLTPEKLYDQYSKIKSQIEDEESKVNPPVNQNEAVKDFLEKN